MGNEQSRQANAETSRKATENEMKQLTAEETEKWQKFYRERPVEQREKWRKKYRERKDQNQETVNEDREPSEVADDSQPLNAPVEVPIRSLDSSQSTPKASDLLASFAPRKEKIALQKRTERSQERTTSDEAIALGPPTPSQSNDLPPTKKLPKLDTKNTKTSYNGTSASESATSKSERQPGPSPNSAGTMPPPSGFSKRPAPSSAFADDRRPSVARGPKIQKRSSAASPQSPDRIKGKPLPKVGVERPPRWYNDTAYPKSRDKTDSNADTLLYSLRTSIERCKKAEFASDRAFREKTFTEVRDKLHKISFLTVNETLLKGRRMLHDDTGLPQVFDPKFNRGVQWPFDIRADAEELYNKWSRRDFETDILRGIITKQGLVPSKKEGAGRNSDSIDPNYKNVVSAKYHGNGDLLNGQWWPLQLCALRDGAHGLTQGGICGSFGDGAYSCIMSGGHEYPDEDYGNTVNSTTGGVTDYTSHMLESIGNHPVRLIRSHNLKTEFAPVIGFRYDGLYDVVGVEKLDPANSMRQRHRFRLERCANQDPIRGGNGPERRPTEQEVEEYRKHQRLSGKIKNAE